MHCWQKIDPKSVVGANSRSKPWKGPKFKTDKKVQPSPSCLVSSWFRQAVFSIRLLLLFAADAVAVTTCCWCAVASPSLPSIKPSKMQRMGKSFNNLLLDEQNTWMRISFFCGEWENTAKVQPQEKVPPFSLFSFQIVSRCATMGCVKSRFEEMPVTGSPVGLKILPGSEKWESSWFSTEGSSSWLPNSTDLCFWYLLSWQWWPLWSGGLLYQWLLPQQKAS